MNKIKITLLVLLFCQAAIAQTPTQAEIVEKRVTRLDQKVELSAEQKERVKSIVESHTARLIALRESNELNNMKRRELVKSERTAIAEILTAEQKEKLKSENADLRQERGERKIAKAERKVQKTVLQEKRMSFEQVLSLEDKAVISKARALKPSKLKKEQRDQLTPEETANRKKAHKEVRTLLKPIAKKHQDALNELYDSLKQDEKEDKKKQKSFAMKFLLMPV